MSKYSIEQSTLDRLAKLAQTLGGATDKLTPEEMIEQLEKRIADDKAFYERDANATFVNPYITYLAYRLFNTDSRLVSIDCPNVEIIDTQAVRYCTELTSINFPKVKTLRSGAFYGPNKITELKLDALVSAESSAFRAMPLIVNVKLPNLQTLGSTTFAECSSLESVEFPSLQSMGSEVFKGSDNLKRIVLPGDTVVSFEGNGALFLGAGVVPDGFEGIYVKDAFVEEYKVATNWAAYADYIKPISEMEVTA